MTRIFAIALSLALLAACGGGSGGDSASPGVDWTLQGLEPLGAGFVYEGWVIVDGAPVSTGRFSVDADGTPSQTSFDLTTQQRDGATTFVLSIEPEPDADPGPSDTKILAGDFGSGQATLVIGHPAALGNDFTSADGLFILATPTTVAGTDEEQGIWFLDPTGPSAGLTLPTLPAGWMYEGWVAGGPGGPISTGRFTDVAAADSDLGGPTAGAEPAPPFPGQDFITPAFNIVGLTAVISVEPEPDDGAAPFAFKPLVASPISGAVAPATQALAGNLGTAPSGTATLR